MLEPMTKRFPFPFLSFRRWGFIYGMVSDRHCVMTPDRVVVVVVVVGGYFLQQQHDLGVAQGRWREIYWAVRVTMPRVKSRSLAGKRRDNDPLAAFFSSFFVFLYCSPAMDFFLRYVRMIIDRRPGGRPRLVRAQPKR